MILIYLIVLIFTEQILIFSKSLNHVNINTSNHRKTKMNQNLKDIISGFVSGWTQVVIMQPFQIVKIRLQTQPQANPYYHGMMDCFKKIAKQEGFLAFYKGTVTPLIGIGFQASAMFFSFQFSKRFLGRFKQNQNDRLPLKLVALSGLIASLPTALIAAPVEHARIRIQIQKGGAAVYAGSIDAGIQIMKNYQLPGLYRGFLPTWGRQAIGQATFFTVYECILRSTIRKDQKPSQAPLLASLIGGAFAGVSFFLLAYPMDYMKTLMQTDNFESLKYKNLRDVFVDRLKTVGIKGFYTGIGVTLVRGIFVNAGGFLAFESSMRALGRSEDSQ